MRDCIFCKIVSGQAPGTILYHDELVTAFRDIHPVAPVHVLVMPKEHMVNLNEAGKGDVALLGRMLRLAAKVANDLDVAESGYRVVINNGDQGGQTVPHLHLHVIGGKPLEHRMG